MQRRVGSMSATDAAKGRERERQAAAAGKTSVFRPEIAKLLWRLRKLNIGACRRAAALIFRLLTYPTQNRRTESYE